MLFTESDLNSTNVWNLLENANYLDESESLISPKTIPVKENSRLGYGVVRFDDVDRLSESHGCDYIDAMYMIAEASEMNPEYLAVAVPEEDVIAYPEIVNELANIVIQPLSEDSLAYNYVDMCLEAWDNTGDEGYLGAIVEDYCLDEAIQLLIESASAQDAVFGPGLVATDDDKYTASAAIQNGKTTGNLKDDLKIVQNAPGTSKVGKAKMAKNALVNAAKRNKKNIAIGAGAAAGAGALALGYKWVKQARNKPKSWIGQKIAALRRIYQKWMQAAQRNPSKAGMIKSVCAKILSIIDALLAKLQSVAG